MNAKIIPLKTKPQKATHTTVDTIEFTQEKAQSWPIPPFQRQLRVNEKVRALAEEIKSNGGVTPGVVTFGTFNHRSFLLDGQHRREAFVLSGMPIGYADVRTCHFDSMAEMGEEFVRLNSRLVSMRPDDILRGLEESIPSLTRIRHDCPFVGYDSIRRSDKSPVLSMSLTLRGWNNATPETPSSRAEAAISIAQQLTPQETDHLIQFLTIAVTAWGRDEEYARLWGGLNLVMSMWLFRHVVLYPSQSKLSRATKLNAALFQKCMMSLSADSKYVDWLRGRRLSEKDRGPCYGQIKSIFARRIFEETKRKAMFPSPAWAG